MGQPNEALRGLLRRVDALDPIVDYGVSGRKTVYEKLLDATQRILAAIHIRFHVNLVGKDERDMMLKARCFSRATLSALAREFGLTLQRAFQISNPSN